MPPESQAERRLEKAPGRAPSERLNCLLLTLRDESTSSQKIGIGE